MHRARSSGIRYLRRRTRAGGARDGVALGWVCVALVGITGLVGMAFDVGSLEVAAQRCQEVADGAALAGATQLPAGPVVVTATGIASANNSEGAGWQVTCNSSDVNTYGPGDTVGGVVLGTDATAVEVTAHGPVSFGFIRLVGLESATAHRTAVAVRQTRTSGYPFVPIWIDRTTAEYAEYAPGETNILMADGPTYPGIPGSFGFLAPPDECTASFRELLGGEDLTEEEMHDAAYGMDDYVYAYPGLNVGQYTQELLDRIERGSEGIYADDTPDSITPGNPRVIITLVTTYVDDGGANAHFEVEGFVAFWLEDVVNITGDKAIEATFLDYYIPGDDLYDTPSYDGFFEVRLIQ